MSCVARRWCEENTTIVVIIWRGENHFMGLLRFWHQLGPQVEKRQRHAGKHFLFAEMSMKLRRNCVKPCLEGGFTSEIRNLSNQAAQSNMAKETKIINHFLPSYLPIGVLGHDALRHQLARDVHVATRRLQTGRPEVRQVDFNSIPSLRLAWYSSWYIS